MARLTKEQEIKMTREEALRNLKELKDYIKKLDEATGYKEDKLFLLSKKEYKKYENVIPKCKTSWWLRSPGLDDEHTVYINHSNAIIGYGVNVRSECLGVRPALKIDTKLHQIGDRISYNTFSFTVIDEDLAIATVPIDFDMFDNWGNEYETSYIREKLLEMEG